MTCPWKDCVGRNALHAAAEAVVFLVFHVPFGYRCEEMSYMAGWSPQCVQAVYGCSLRWRKSEKIAFSYMPPCSRGARELPSVGKYKGLARNLTHFSS